jgi:hypothetical protein
VYGYNTQNQNKPLFGAKDHCVQNSEGTVNINQVIAHFTNECLRMSELPSLKGKEFLHH